MWYCVFTTTTLDGLLLRQKNYVNSRMWSPCSCFHSSVNSSIVLSTRCLLSWCLLWHISVWSCVYLKCKYDLVTCSNFKPLSTENKSGNEFSFDNIQEALWVVIITMTTVGYGDVYPRTHYGRVFGVFSCLIGMLLVSYLVVGMNSLFDFTPQE